MSELRSYSLIKDTDELRKLILENPDLPIAILAGQNAGGSDCYYTYCSSISFGISEMLDCDFYDYDDSVFTDRDRLKERIEDLLYDEYCEKPEEEYNAAVKKELGKYEPYWTKVIAIWADN